MPVKYDVGAVFDRPRANKVRPYEKKVRRVDDLGRIVIPKEIRRTLRIREGDPLLTTMTVSEKYLWAMKILSQRLIAQQQKTAHLSS